MSNKNSNKAQKLELASESSIVALDSKSLGMLKGGGLFKSDQVCDVNGQLVTMRWPKRNEEEGIAYGPWQGIN